MLLLLIIIIIIIIIISPLVTGFSFPGISHLDSAVNITTRLHFLVCRTFLIMCDVPRRAVLVVVAANVLNAFVVLFPEIFSNLVTIPMSPMSTGVTKHFICHGGWGNLYQHSLILKHTHKIQYQNV
jgi:hypothetical protein